MENESDDTPSGSGPPEEDENATRDLGKGPERRPLDSATPRETEVSVSVVFGILADERQQYALYSLTHHDGRATLSDLALQLAAAENRTSIELATNEMVARVRAGLYHAHLPLLVDYGFMEFDRVMGVVTLTDQPDRIDQHLELAHEREDATNEYLPYLERMPDATLTETDDDTPETCRDQNDTQ